MALYLPQTRPYSDKKGRFDEQVRGDVVSYLGCLYHSVAETLPDVRDDAFDGDRAAFVAAGLTDEYAIELNKQATADPQPEALNLNPDSKKKPRKMCKGVKLNPDRLAGSPTEGGMEIRKLPPGSMKEYHEQYKIQSPLQAPASFPYFWRVPWNQISNWCVTITDNWLLDF